MPLLCTTLDVQYELLDSNSSCSCSSTSACSVLKVMHTFGALHIQHIVDGQSRDFM